MKSLEREKVFKNSTLLLPELKCTKNDFFAILKYNWPDAYQHVKAIANELEQAWQKESDQKFDEVQKKYFAYFCKAIKMVNGLFVVDSQKSNKKGSVA